MHDLFQIAGNQVYLLCCFLAALLTGFYLTRTVCSFGSRMMIIGSPTPQRDRATIGSALRAKLSLFPGLWREGHRQAAKDFRARWRRCGMWCLVAIWLFSLIFSFIAFILIDTEFRGGLSACLPDGSFSVEPENYRYFSGSGFFEITLAFGNMTFTQVKALDVAWDILVGRGGQSLVAYISWRVFANYVTTSMEVMPVTFRTYRTIFLQNGSLLVGIPRLIRDFCSRHALHSRLAMIFIVFTMAFSLAFPTLVSSLTGYKANVDPFVMISQGNYVPFSSFRYVSFIVHDGWRVKLDGNPIILSIGTEESKHPSPVEPTMENGRPSHFGCFGSDSMSEDCSIFDKVHGYALRYGINGENNVKSWFGNDIELSPPVLNISAFSVVGRMRKYKNERAFIELEQTPMRWAYENTTYDESYMLQNGKCQPNLNYQWGFSFIQSFITVILTLIWSIGIYIMWLRSHSIMKRRGRTDIAGEHKAVLELAHAMQQQHADLSSPAKEPQQEDGASVATTTSTAVTVTEATLRHRVTKELHGGSIAYAAPLLANGETADTWTLRAWVKAHRWSIAGMTLCLGFPTLAAPFLGMVIPLFVPLPIVLAFALYIGSTRGSRAVLFFWSFALCGLVPQIVFSVLIT